MERNRRSTLRTRGIPVHSYRPPCGIELLYYVELVNNWLFRVLEKRRKEIVERGQDIKDLYYYYLLLPRGEQENVSEEEEEEQEEEEDEEQSDSVEDKLDSVLSLIHEQQETINVHGTLLRNILCKLTTPNPSKRSRHMAGYM